MKRPAEHNVAQLVEQILIEAIQFGASDVHFEPTSSELQVRFRLD